MGIEEANRLAIERIIESRPILVDIKYAREVFPQMTKFTLLHAGPPIEWTAMCGPMKGGVIGALLYEGLAKTEEEALRLVERGKVKFLPCHEWGAVGPMTGIVSFSMPLFIVKNEKFGNVAYTTINEGMGKVLRFGAYAPKVIERLHWMEEVLAPVLKEAIEDSGGIDLKAIVSQALQMGDELHLRNIASSSLLIKTIMSHLVKRISNRINLLRIVEFLTRNNDQFFLNLAMAMGKATMDTLKGIEKSTLVTAMARNGVYFGIKVSGLGERWFTAPANRPQGLYFPGFKAEDACADLGDSAIMETVGLGGFAIAAAPAIVQFLGLGTQGDAINYTKEMYEITVAKHSYFLIPTLDFEGSPIGIDIRKVVETGITPLINTGIAHKKPGIGQIGAGIVRAPLEPFKQALLTFAESQEI